MIGNGMIWARAGLLGQMIADELEGEAAANKDNYPLTPDEMLETPFDYLDEEDI